MQMQQTLCCIPVPTRQTNTTPIQNVCGRKFILPLTETTDYLRYSGKENDNVLNSIDEKYAATGAEFKPMYIVCKAQYFTIDAVPPLLLGNRSESRKGFG